MARFSSAVLLLVTVLSGCVPVNRVLSADQVVRVDFREIGVREELNRKVGGDCGVVVETTDGRRFEGCGLTLAADSTRFSVTLDSADASRASLPAAVATSEIRMVGFYVYGTKRYGLVGAVAGALLGIVPGAYAGLAGENATPLEERQGSNRAIRNGALAGVVLGGLLGAALLMFAEGDLGPSVWRRYENRGAG